MECGHYRSFELEASGVPLRTAFHRARRCPAIPLLAGTSDLACSDGQALRPRQPAWPIENNASEASAGNGPIVVRLTPEDNLRRST